MAKPYSEGEIQYLKRNHNCLSLAQLTESLKRSEIGITAKLNSLMTVYHSQYDKEKVMDLRHLAQNNYETSRRKDHSYSKPITLLRNHSIDTLVDQGLNMEAIGKKINKRKQAVDFYLSTRNRKKYYFKIQRKKKKEKYQEERSELEYYILRGNNHAQLAEVLNKKECTISRRIKIYGLRKLYLKEHAKLINRANEQRRAKIKSELTDLINQGLTVQEIAKIRKKKPITFYKAIKKTNLTGLYKEKQRQKKIKEFKQEYPGIDEYIQQGLSQTQIRKELGPTIQLITNYLSLIGKTSEHKEIIKKKKEQKLKIKKEKAKKLRKQGIAVHDIAKTLKMANRTIKGCLEE